MDPVQVAWFAGIFEGEGTIDIGEKIVRISIGMTDLDIIERLNNIFPSPAGAHLRHRTQIRKDGKPYKDIYIWRVGRTETVREIFTAILPYLGDRRKAKALEALAFLATRPGRCGGRHCKNNTHCKQGHEFTPENTVYGRANNPHWRRCRICYKLQYSAANKKKAAKKAITTKTARLETHPTNCLDCGQTLPEPSHYGKPRLRCLVCNKQRKLTLRRKHDANLALTQAPDTARAGGAPPQT